MKKLIIFLLPFLFLTGCRKDLTSLNVDPKNPQSVPSYALFTNAQRTLARTLASPNVNLNIFRLIEQNWTETTYTDESNYDLQTRQIPRGMWNALYRDILKDFQESRKLIPTESDIPATAKKNQLAIVDVMEVYTWYYLVTTFGNVPYSEALNIDNPFPKYDAQTAIFADLLKRISADIVALNGGGDSFGESDIIYGGDVDKWKTFAASIKLKIGMTLADVDPAAAKAAVESAFTAGVMASNADNAEFHFLAAPPNVNPVWEDLVESGRKDFVATETIVDTMSALNDPRISLFFTTDAAGGYSGGTPGSGNNYSTFSKPNETISNPDFPHILLDYSEVEFFLAEAKERGYNVSGTAAGHYNSGVMASVEWWGGSMADAMTYLAQPGVNYLTATGNYKRKIAFQKWLALYNRGWDMWIENRRLDFPALPDPTDALSGFPTRFTYSIDEQNINTINYTQAAQAIGGDEVETKLFWDKF